MTISRRELLASVGGATAAAAIRAVGSQAPPAVASSRRESTVSSVRLAVAEMKRFAERVPPAQCSARPALAA